MAMFGFGTKNKRGYLPRAAATLGLALLLMLGTAAAGAAASPPLTGEDLEWSSPGGFPLGQFNGNFACFSNANTGDYSVLLGVATGPYPGTFNEDGSFTVNSAGVVTDWKAHFSIMDSTGAIVVTGDKTMVVGTGGPGAVSCSNVSPFTNSGSGSATLNYTAKLPDGSIVNGTSVVKGSFTETNDSMAGSRFSEMFGVKTPVQQITNLIALVQSQQLGPGKSLVSKLKGILASVQAGKIKTACNRLHALENEVAAQSGKSIPADSGVLAAVKQIKVALGC